MAKARKQFSSSLSFADGHILRIRVWEVPLPVPPSEHVVLYDNERGKGDHRHYGDREEAYHFSTVEALIADFLADVRRERGVANER